MINSSAATSELLRDLDKNLEDLSRGWLAFVKALVSSKVGSIKKGPDMTQASTEFARQLRFAVSYYYVELINSLPMESREQAHKQLFPELQGYFSIKADFIDKLIKL